MIARTSRPSSGSVRPYTTNARNLIGYVFNRLTKVSNQVISGTTYMSVDAKQSPFLLPGANEDGSVEFVCNFAVMRRST